MVKVIFVQPDGTRIPTQADPGDSVMSVATRQGIDGIIGECGGSMMCATCHCYVDEDWTQATGPRMDGEDDMLDSASCEVRPTSRLSCQIRISDALDGVVIHLPESQI